MSSSLRCLVALLASGVATCAIADERVNVLTTVVVASEAPVKSVMFPLSSTSPLMVTPCASCAPESHAITAETLFFIGRRAVTLQELRSAVEGKPDLMLTVSYSVKTGELVRLTADPPQSNAAPARRR
jgi:hypothetical protein